MTITKEQVMTLADVYACEAMENMEYPNQHKVDKARAALLEAVEQLAGKSAAVDSQDLTIAYMAGRHDAQKSAVSEPCRHRIADARNALVQSGYVCVDCGAVFAAADHAAAVSEPVAWPAAWMYEGEPYFDGDKWREKKGLTVSLQVAQFKSGTIKKIIPLYTTPPAEAKREPLTHDKIWEIWHGQPKDGAITVTQFARAIEAAHGIVNIGAKE